MAVDLCRRGLAVWPCSRNVRRSYRSTNTLGKLHRIFDVKFLCISNTFALAYWGYPSAGSHEVLLLAQREPSYNVSPTPSWHSELADILSQLTSNLWSRCVLNLYPVRTPAHRLFDLKRATQYCSDSLHDTHQRLAGRLHRFHNHRIPSCHKRELCFFVDGTV